MYCGIFEYLVQFPTYYENIDIREHIFLFFYYLFNILLVIMARNYFYNNMYLY